MVLSASFTAYADVISDTPFEDTSADAVIVDSPDSTGTSASGVAAPAASSSAGSSTASSAGSSTASTTASDAASTAASATASAPAVSAANAAAGASESKPVPGTTTAGSGSTSGSTSSAVTAGASVTAQTGSAAAGPGTGSSGTSVIGPGSTTASASASVTSTASAAVSSSGVPGSDHANDPKVQLDLGFTVVSPNYDYNGYKVAEGSVQLSDGSWETIGHDKYIRQPYFRLLREDGDWYIVAVNARRIGNYYTSDGSRITELWLKKSECVAKNYIEVNTTNSQRQQIVKTAFSLLGKGYQYAGNGPDAYDCSGLVNAVMTSCGISIARTSSEICSAGTQVGITGLRPGDIVGRSGHVGVYIGNGYFLHAAESTTGVVTEDLNVYNRNSRFTNYCNVVGD